MKQNTTRLPDELHADVLLLAEMNRWSVSATLTTLVASGMSLYADVLRQGRREPIPAPIETKKAEIGLSAPVHPLKREHVVPNFK